LELTEKTILPNLRKALADHKRRFPGKASESQSLAFVIASAQGGRLQAGIRQFFFDAREVPQRESWEVEKGHVKTFFAGNGEEAREYLQEHADLYRSPDTAKTARMLVQIGERAHPEVVGGPVSIAAVDATGVHWVDPGVCH
jgi:hypothetical protein